jgi:predicted enzyme related to lactoylglutathione lyase
MLTNAPAYPNIPVTDLDRAKKFYNEVLGLEIEEDSFPGMVLLKGGDSTKVMLYVRPQTNSDHTLMSFVVEDIYATAEDLASKGVKFEQYDLGNGIKTDEKGVASMGVAKAAWFKDSEGNILGLNNKIDL